MTEPTKVALQYNQRSLTIPENIAGAIDRAGFIDVPEMNDRKKISIPITEPIAIQPNPLSPFVDTASKIIPIKKAVAATSIPKIRGIG